MSKTEFLEVLGKELERLETVEHVSDLVNNGRYDEVEDILRHINYTPLEEYLDECDDDGDLKISEIPEGRYLTFIIYMYGSGCDPIVIMEIESYSDLTKVLYDCGEAAAAIASVMNICCIEGFTLKELCEGSVNIMDKGSDE